MSWVTVIWSMTAAACLTLASIQFLVWCQRRSTWANLFFALTSTATAAYAAGELSMMRADTPAQFATSLRWLQVPVWVIVVSLVGFVRLHLRAGRPWLGWAACATRTLALVLNFLSGQNLNYLEVTHLRRVAFLGEPVSIGIGVSNPLMLVGQLSLVLWLVFVTDATIIAWRRGDRRRALLTGGSIVFFAATGTAQAVLVLWQLVDWPLTESFFYLGIVVAMGYELSRDTLRAAQLSDDLRESEDRLTLAAEAADLGHWVLNTVENEVWASETLRRLFGFAPGERVNYQAILGRIHPDDRERVDRGVLRAVAERSAYAVDYRVIWPDGSQHWLAARGRMYPAANGKPARMLGATIDITQRKRSEEVLRESEERFSAIANSAPVLIWMSGTDKLCNFFNAGWLEFTGRTLEQELGNGWTEGVHPDDFARCLKIYTESFEARRPFTMEYRLRHRDGGYRWISDIGVPRYESDRNFLGYIGSCVDLTERKRAEERFRLVVEASPNGNVLVNDQGRIVLVNTQTEKLFGYGREELIGKPIEILVPERFRGRHPDYRTGFVARPEARAMGAGRELFARRKDGTEFPVEIGLSPIQTSEGLLVLTVIVDITARKQTEARVLRQRAELTHVARVSTMGALASSLAHELNQPLSAILSNAQAGTRFMAQTPPDLLEIKGALEDIARDAKRAGEVIRQMRGLVKREEPKLAPLNLNRVILDVARLLHSDMLIRKVYIAQELDPDLPLTDGDSIQLQQVILNLVLNAFDAVKDAPEARRTVIVRTRQPGAAAIQAEVIDEGTGIAPDRLGTLFEPFRSTKRDGLGVGLSISRSIVEAHKGRIWAEQNSEHGATFYVQLPVHQG